MCMTIAFLSVNEKKKEALNKNYDIYHLLALYIYVISSLFNKN